MPCRSKILVAEDDPADLLLLQRAFAKADIPAVVDFVENGDDLVTHLQEAGDEGPAVLVLDLQMPRKNGFEILDWFEHEPQSRPPFVIVLTGSSRADDIARCATYHVDHYMVKPTEPAELLHMVQTIQDCFKSVMSKMPSFLKRYG